MPPSTHEVRRGFFENCGIGIKLNSTEYDHVYETSPYSLFDYTLHRFSRSSLRVVDPKDAVLFFIPFDITHNTWMAASKIKNRRLSLLTEQQDAKKNRRKGKKDEWSHLRSQEAAEQRVRNVIAYLNSSAAFLKNMGRDHFFVEDDSPYFDWKHGVDAWKEFHHFCRFCLVVTPDTTVALRERFRSVIEPSKVVAAPHPSAVS